MRMSLLMLTLLSFSLSAQQQAQPIIAKTTIAAVPIIHQINQLVDQRNSNSPLFSKVLQANNLDQQKAVLLGLGRIGGKTVIPQIAPFLNHPAASLRQQAAFSLGISGEKSAAPLLWGRLASEADGSVKKEIYLGLGNLGEDYLISKLLQRVTQETSAEIRSYLYQGLAIALTFHRDLTEDYSQLDLKPTLQHFASGNRNDAIAGYFLNRVPGIETLLKADELLVISSKKLSLESQVNLARLIGKVSKINQPANRKLLAWAIERSESNYLPLQLEAVRAMQNMTDVPQALIQLGKLTVAPNPVVAQTSLNVLANSTLQSDEVVQLFKQQLKNSNDAMVVESISGLVQRQTKDQMSWIVQLFRHPSSYVKINLLSQLKAKSESDPAAYPASDLTHLLKFFSDDTNAEVARYASSLLNKKETAPDSPAESPAYAEAIKAIGKTVTLKTTVGNITIELLADAPYTSWHFLNNARLGNFTNSYFSRVIGNFVAQGGDTIGDLQGASGKTIREEINFLAHEPMTVGMATSGKDTGSSQFFINTARNPHLDRNYTVFGRVIAGQDVVMMMTNGAKVLNVVLN